MKGHIEDYISQERENPTSKKDLTAQTGLNERAARSHIAEARRRGCLLSGSYPAAIMSRKARRSGKLLLSRSAAAPLRRLSGLPSSRRRPPAR